MASLVGKSTAVPPSELHHFHRNARRGDVPAIMASLRRHSQYKPITANVGTHTGRPNEVLAGNHTLMAFRELAEVEPGDRRWHKIMVFWVDVDDDMAERINVADNKTGSLGDYDGALLAEQVAGFGDDLDGLGYSEEEAADLLKLLDPADPSDDNDPVIGDPDELPEDHGRPRRTQVGQRWQLGPHRLLIGDSTDADLIRYWLEDEPADVVWTDPPYGVDYVGKTKDAMTIQNDGAAGLVELIAKAAETIVSVARPGCPVYIAAPSGPQFAEFAEGLREGGVQWRQTLAWVKNTMVLGRSDYHYRHEAVFYGFTPAPSGSGRLGRGGDHWFGDNSQTTVLFYDKPAASEDHPTMKPVDLIAAMLANSCPERGLVLDLFAGSGSTMVAAHSLNMRAALVELDPVYAQVIIDRYEKISGGTAVLLD